MECQINHVGRLAMPNHLSQVAASVCVAMVANVAANDEGKPKRKLSWVGTSSGRWRVCDALRNCEFFGRVANTKEART